ncbi:MerR family transcriptional regulator [Pararoseomonas indoligenes]|uniref:Helix-turn-helix domain-containing protein n=1 Tax=Roseomonas indoligenes TaxID=2820811 RepID=A0A940MVJ7_9PROT|nr:helix-turn-helix domain-containing protein [Pararoseomonas indoligenes]MBP0491559.1 helix-turn-helix domain-containing protein [Pararoseomonas indoligenes]
MDRTIGALARLADVKVPTIRYYEEIGLLPAAPRTESNRRLYGEEAVRRLRFIRHARDLGFEVEAIRQLLALADQPERPCAEVDGIARAHLAAIDDRIARLTALRTEIGRMTECGSHGRVGDCQVIQVLADHGLCTHPQH